MTVLNHESKRDKVSVVIPVYYNHGSLQELYKKICVAATQCDTIELEILFVDDNSGDNSFNLICDIASKDSRVHGLKLSRNFGSFVACHAGLDHCTGDCVVIMSADLQDPPELIISMYKKWKEGNKVVLAVRSQRDEGFFKVFFARIYYRVFRLLVTKDMPKDGFDFVLIDRDVINILTSMQEKNTTLMGLVLWMGFRRAEIPYTRAERKYGKSRWTLYKKINYFLDSIMSFSKFPIRIFSMCGLFISCIGFLGIVYIFLAYALGWIRGVSGWPSLMVFNLLAFGLLFIGIGIIGEYIWRSLEEVRKRPLYIVETSSDSESFCTDIKEEEHKSQLYTIELSSKKKDASFSAVKGQFEETVGQE